ncbi:OmpP1/FadL family transporter [Desulfurella sp.]|uniref:OmpP1/FadL family transporter n=1 Tax=Desulfurella sp. TaxID=1962857 RepID=UPI0025C5824D|nr:outer membrane protein transport protein [Desulfurella sp.]
MLKKHVSLAVALAVGLSFGVANKSFATNGYYMTGLGAKQIALGGAVVANPQDASTILTNPAGISWLPTSSASVGGDIFVPLRYLNGQGSQSNVYVVPAAGVAINPKGCNCQESNFTWGIGMYGVSGMGVDWNNPNGFGMAAPLQKVYSNMQMMEMDIAGSYRIDGHLSIGFAPVFVYQAMSLEMDMNNEAIAKAYGYGSYAGGAPFATGTAVNSLNAQNAYGAGFNLGLVYKLNDMWQFGLAYQSKRWMQTLQWNTIPNAFNPATGQGMLGGMFDGYKVRMRLDMPQTIQFGVNFRPVNNLRIEADAKWINWSNVMDKVPITGVAGMNSWDFNWKNQWVYMLGVEYTPTPPLTLMAGFNYGKSPVPDGGQAFGNNIIAPAIVQTHLSFGASYSVTPSVQVTAAYQHAFEHKQSGTFDGMPISIKMHEDEFAVQLTYKF